MPAPVIIERITDKLKEIYENEGIEGLVFGEHLHIKQHRQLRYKYGPLPSGPGASCCHRKYPNRHAIKLLNLDKEMNEYMKIPVLSYDTIIDLIAEFRNIMHYVPPHYGLSSHHLKPLMNEDNLKDFTELEEKIKNFNDDYRTSISIQSLPSIVKSNGKTWDDVLEHFGASVLKTAINGHNCRSQAEVKCFTELELRGLTISTSIQDLKYSANFLEDSKIYKRQPYYDAIVTGLGDPFYVELWGNIDAAYMRRKEEKIAYHKKHNIRILCVDYASAYDKYLKIEIQEQLGEVFPPVLPEYEDIPITYYKGQILGPFKTFIYEEDRQKFLEVCRTIQQQQKDKLFPVVAGKSPEEKGYFHFGDIKILEWDLRRFYKGWEEVRSALGEDEDMIRSMRCWSKDSEKKISYLLWWKKKGKGRLFVKKSFIEKDEISKGIPPTKYGIGQACGQWRCLIKNNKKSNSICMYLLHRLRSEGLEDLILDGAGNCSSKPGLITYQEAVKIIAPQNFTSKQRYEDYVREHPDYHLPICPKNKYSKSKEWKGWKEFLGSGCEQDA